MSNKVFCVTNQKGGVGKTTTAVNLGACLATGDLKVLIVDIDPQGNATTGLGISKDGDGNNIYNALISGQILRPMIHDTAVHGLKIIPSTTDLYGAEVEMVSFENREFRLDRLIKQVEKNFDYIIIDCPPSLGLLTLNGLVAADSALVPIQTEFFALEGVSQLVRTIDMVRDTFNPKLSIDGIIFTMVDGRTTLSNQVMSEVKNHFGDVVFDTVVPRNVRLSEAPSYGEPIILYDFKSKGAFAYIELAHEFLRRNGGAQNESAMTAKGSEA